MTAAVVLSSSPAKTGGESRSLKRERTSRLIASCQPPVVRGWYTADGMPCNDMKSFTPGAGAGRVGSAMTAHLEHLAPPPGGDARPAAGPAAPRNPGPLRRRRHRRGGGAPDLRRRRQPFRGRSLRGARPAALGARGRAAGIDPRRPAGARTARGGGRLREIPAGPARRAARGGGADSARAPARFGLHLVDGRLPAALHLLRDRAPRFLARARGRRDGRSVPARAGREPAPGDQRGFHGDGRAAAELRRRHPRRLHPLATRRRRHLVEGDQHRHRRRGAGHPALHRRAPPVPALHFNDRRLERKAPPLPAPRGGLAGRGTGGGDPRARPGDARDG